MGFLEREVAGRVLLPPHETQLQPRVRDAGGRNVPVVTLRVELEDGAVRNIVFMGELDGQVSQDDYLVARGYSRGRGIFRANQLWLRGRLDAGGDWVDVDPPVCIGNRKVCAIATAVFGKRSLEVEVLRRFRDETLARTRAGRFSTRVYYFFAPWIAMQVLEPHPRLAAWTRRGLSRFIRRHL